MIGTDDGKQYESPFHLEIGQDVLYKGFKPTEEMEAEGIEGEKRTADTYFGVGKMLAKDAPNIDFDKMPLSENVDDRRDQPKMSRRDLDLAWRNNQSGEVYNAIPQSKTLATGLGIEDIK